MPQENYSSNYRKSNFKAFIVKLYIEDDPRGFGQGMHKTFKVFLDV